MGRLLHQRGFPDPTRRILRPVHGRESRALLMLAGLTLALALDPHRAAASEHVLDFTGGSASPAGGMSVIGWEFTASSTIDIDGLGFWDENGDGLTVTHDVGIWNGDGSALLASTTVSSSDTFVASSSPDGFWLFRSIPRITLLPGSYVVAATVGDFDSIRNSLSTALAITTIPEVSYVEARFLGSASLVYPPSSFPIDSFGANVRLAEPEISLPALPEIGAVALVSVLGIVGRVHLRARRVRKRS